MDALRKRWFQFVFLFSPLSLGFHDSIWLAHTFQMGWFSHQPELVWKNILLTLNIYQQSGWEGPNWAVIIPPRLVGLEKKGLVLYTQDYRISHEIRTPLTKLYGMSLVFFLKLFRVQLGHVFSSHFLRSKIGSNPPPLRFATAVSACKAGIFGRFFGVKI